MRLVEVAIDVPSRERSAAERVAYSLGAQGVEVRDEATGGPRGRVAVIVWMPSSTSPALLTAAIRRDLPRAIVRVRRVEATWASSPAPVPIGHRFVVVGRDGAAPAERVPLRVDGALGFGDGVHPTTALCVEMLERVVARARPRSVLDVGTGTGILAIAAAKLGVRDVVATDIDPLARHAARWAVRANDVGVRVQSALPARTFDVVIANLYYEPLLALAPELVARAGRVLIVSGFTRRQNVERALAPLVVRTARSRARFHCLELTPQRRSSASSARSARR